ncbi:uncharacterized protein LOC143905475 isoform X2 [Temnothorax americanus]|uniref:uncharacterized protein LOC143905475 isoform X2 n=1 Tax=Temnothorax americanus TaxID=1964332 RepID=UPI004068DC57
MLFYAVSVFSVVAFRFSATAEFTLPVTTCKRNSADYFACLKHALEEAWPRFIQGLPEYDFPSLDPIFFEHGKLLLTANELHGELTGTNITVIGLAQTRFFDVRTHFLDDVFRLELDTQVPKVYAKGAVKMDGAVNVFRVLGNDDLIVSFVNEYWPPLYRILLPIMADFWDPWLVKNIANKFFSKVSFSELFP